ncbi:predicted protein [Naegleria gruberi]|uniref:Predicted protein n=1 Tax=Naegleria gruberi TaxID=5762 RepID=D2UZ26_NAEGR|nr:uncharacterized protein NAEGRDRAFT_29803 [Naegleria gruberi]EFC50077.1 predicted protein [Naegleria gruberi]|eukprot:XP_002682821.1 predicted protein [Naegleria gruberi strain NEG-M]
MVSGKPLSECSQFYLLSHQHNVSVSEIIGQDPLYPKQWHLKNNGQSQSVGFGDQDSGSPGNDVNIWPVWEKYRLAGYNITLAIVDDGVQYDHPDLECGFQEDLSKDVSSYGTPSEYGAPGGSGDNHGTSCAGVCCGRSNNHKCGVGAAFESNVASIRALGDAYSDSVVAEALSHFNDRIDIYSNSYGPSDDGVTVERYPLSIMALVNGIQKGRNGLGNIYVWASGNGAKYGDSSDWDELANSPYTICVAATDWRGKRSDYSESGTSTLINAPSNNYYNGGYSFTSKIVTIDRTGSNGYTSGDCYDSFGGTSSACPLAAGVLALILQARRDLTWRDVQHILVATAKRTDLTHSEWIKNGAGLYHNIHYGFGRIDAYAAVQAAMSWSLISSPYLIESFGPDLELGSEGLKLSESSTSPTIVLFEVKKKMKVESAVISLTVSVPSRGSVYFALRSPAGTISMMGRGRRNDHSSDIEDQTFTSVQFWNETATGVWSFSIYTSVANVAHLKKIGLTLHGSEILHVEQSEVVPEESNPSDESQIIPFHFRVGAASILLAFVTCLVIAVVVIAYLKRKYNREKQAAADSAANATQVANRGSFYYRN